MIYKFKSKSAGDVIMMGANGDQLLRLLGREPAPKGILESATLPGAIAALEQAVAADEQARAEAEAEAARDGKKLPAAEGVSLRQRLWPMVDMMKRAHKNGHDITWGV